MSPLSQVVTFELFKRIKHLDMDFNQALKMELNLAETMILESDYFEAVRSMLIDRDYSPKW